jgi:hypothetical protein
MNKKGQPIANNGESPLKAEAQHQEQEQPNEENIQDFM